MFFVEVGIFLLNLFYAIIKVFTKQRKKILFLSRQTDRPSIDFRMLIGEINNEYEDFDVVVITKRVEKNVKSVLTKNVLLIFRQMYHLATCSVCVVDGYNISVSVLKHRKSMKVVQIWHSLAAIKKFGYETLDTNRRKKIAKVMRMHKNYDYIICGSNSMIKHFQKAFNYDRFNFYPLGLPRIDYLLSHEKINGDKIYRKYPKLRNKKIIIYAPTFRGNNNYRFNELIDSIDLDRYVLIIKKHPNIKEKIVTRKNVYTMDKFSTLQLLSIVDYVITDYSAFSIEAAILEKPVYLYTYDYDEYVGDTGLNINLEKELPGYVFHDAVSLFNKLDKEKYDMDVIKNFKKKYVCNCNGDVTSNLARFIVERSEMLDEKD